MSEPTIDTDQDNSLSSSSKDLLLPETMVGQVNSTSENILQPKMENHTVSHTSTKILHIINKRLQ